MRKILLFITFILSFSFSYAESPYTYYNSFEANSEKDTSSVDFLKLQKLKLYPIPATTSLFVDYDIIFVKEAKLQIYNSIGSVVYTKTLIEKQDKIKIYVSNFENGLYFCSLKIDGNLLLTKKILINH